MRRGEPRGHWLLLLLGGLALTVLLLLDGYAHGAVGEAPRKDPVRPVPAPANVTSGGPVINLSGGEPHSLRMPAKTIALTFDDGPDPEWTPRILDVLRRHKAHATFFAVGAHIAQNPGLTRRILREGNEIGSHTYTHVDLATTPAWRARLELDLTQRALAGAAGVHTRLIRMPYSSVPDGLTAPEWRAARRAGDDGYVVVLTDRDTEDWRRPGTAAIVKAAVTGGRRGAGAVVMLHDAGGDRAQTVAALEQIIDRLQPLGYRFTTLSAALRMPAADIPATGREKAVGWTLVTAQRTASAITGWLAALFGLAGALYVGRLVLLLVFAHVHVRRVRGRSGRSGRRRPGRHGPSRGAPPGFSPTSPSSSPPTTRRRGSPRRSGRSSTPTTPAPSK